MQNGTGCLAWAWFSSSIWPSNFIKHLHSSSSGAPNPVLWDMANRFAAAGPGTTCHQPGALVKRPQVDQVEPELFQPLDGWRFWPCKSSWKIPCFIFEVWCRSRHYGSSVWHDNLTPPLLQRIVGQIQAFQVSASLQSCLFWKTAGIKVIAPVPIGVHQKQEIVTTEDQLTHITHIINIQLSQLSIHVEFVLPIHLAWLTHHMLLNPPWMERIWYCEIWWLQRLFFSHAWRFYFQSTHYPQSVFLNDYPAIIISWVSYLSISWWNLLGLDPPSWSIVHQCNPRRCFPHLVTWWQTCPNCLQ